MAATLYYSQGAAVGFGGTAIAGDNPSPYGSGGLASTGPGILTTGDLPAGDAGEAGSLDGMTIEFWALFDNAVPVSATIAQGPRSTVGTSRQWVISTSGDAPQFSVINNAGTQINSNTAGSAIPGSISASPPGPWNHIVGVIRGSNIYVYLNGVESAAVSFVGPIRPSAFTATVSDMNLIGAGSNTWFVDELAFYRTGLTAARVLEHYNAGVNRGWFAQLPGTRIISVLDAVSSTAPRSIQAGTRTVIPRYQSGQSPLSEVQHAVEAEDVDAVFFAAKDGTLTFLADGYRSASPYSTSQVTLGDGGGAEIPYKDITLDYSESFLINEWNVTRSGYGNTTAVTQTASDATSISRYFKRSQSLSDVPTTTDGNCATIATALLAKYKDPMQRVTSVTMQASAADTTAAVLARDLADRITVKRRPPGGGSPISQDVFIEKIDISGSNDGAPWVVSWGVSPQ